MPTITTDNTASELVRSTPLSPLQVAFRQLEFGDFGDVEKLDEVFSPDMVDHNPHDPDAASAFEGVRALVGGLRAGFTDTTHRVLFYLELPDNWVAVHWELTATHTGDFWGFPATGNQVAMKGIDLIRVEDDRVVELRHVEDLLALTQQLSTSAQAE